MIKPIQFAAVLATLAYAVLPLCADDKASNSLEIAKHYSRAMADTVERVMPSVVVIETEATRQYLDLFRRRVIPMDEQIGQGSGVIISKDGYVLTNNHVLQGAERAHVVLHDGQVFEAAFIDHYPDSDIAVLKIKAPKGETFTPITPGNSDTIRVGETVMAIGSPFSLRSTVTQGIISQKGRSNESLPLVDFIQTSASINPGNSGGPLVNLDGHLIGINTYIQTGGPYSRGNIGIGFAIPSKQALGIAQLLIEGKRPRITWIGINMEETPYGVFVTYVAPESPAERAGLLRGDVIYEMNDEPIPSIIALRNRVLRTRPGQTINTKVIRNRRSEVVLEIKSELMPERSAQYR